MSKVWATVKHEFHEVLPPTIFFFISFHIVVLDRALMLREYGLQLSAVAGATVGALLVAKVVLIADKLPIINRFPEKPLIYNVVWKTVVYVGFSLLLHYLEHLVRCGGSWAALGGDAKLGWKLAALLGDQLWLVVLIFIYCAMRGSCA